MRERWRPIPGFSDYEASNKGRIRLLNGSIVKGHVASGYKFISINASRYRFHRLIALTWIDNPLEKPCINHIDGVKLNNNISNLEWCTASENTAHAVKMGLNKLTKKQLAATIKRSSRPVIIVDLLSGREIEYSSLAKFSRRSGYHYMSIGKCRRRNALLDCRYIIMSKDKIMAS